MISPEPSPLVAVVILNWNRRADTLACVQSVEASDWSSITTVVVDNASDEPIEHELSERSEQAVFVRNAANLGFAGGMNVGLRRALELGAEFVLLLNNDTVVDPAMVRHLVQAARARPDSGIVSPLVLDRDHRRIVLSAGRTFDPARGHPGKPLMAGRPDPELSDVREVVASSGEAMLVSRRAVERVGPLDEALFLRLEDIDWSLRMRSAGLKNYVVFNARLWHEVSASSGGEHSAMNAYYHTRNILVVGRRHARNGAFRRAARETEVLIANLYHARRGDSPLENVRAVIDGWRDYRRDRLGRKA